MFVSSKINQKKIHGMTNFISKNQTFRKPACPDNCLEHFCVVQLLIVGTHVNGYYFIVYSTPHKRTPETGQCTQLIVGDQYSDLDTMNFLGAKLAGGSAGAPPMWTLCATPRAVMDALQEKGFELNLAQTIESHITWIMTKPDVMEKKPDERKKSETPPPPYTDEWGQSEDSMHSMPRGPRKVPIKSKPQSKEGVETAVTVAGAKPPRDETHRQSRHRRGEKRQVVDENEKPVVESADSIPIAPAENENETFSARPTPGKTGKAKPRTDTQAPQDANHFQSKQSDSSDEEYHKTPQDDPAVTVKKRKSPPKEKKSSPKKGSKKSIED